MKAYCENCGTAPASFRPGNDAKTDEPFEDLCCDQCHLVLATVSGREGGYNSSLPTPTIRSPEALSHEDARGAPAPLLQQALEALELSAPLPGNEATWSAAINAIYAHMDGVMVPVVARNTDVTEGRHD